MFVPVHKQSIFYTWFIFCYITKNGHLCDMPLQQCPLSDKVSQISTVYSTACSGYNEIQRWQRAINVESVSMLWHLHVCPSGINIGIVCSMPRELPSHTVVSWPVTCTNVYRTVVKTRIYRRIMAIQFVSSSLQQGTHITILSIILLPTYLIVVKMKLDIF